MKLTQETVEEKLVDGTKAALFVATLLGGATIAAKTLTFVGRNMNNLITLLKTEKETEEEHVEEDDEADWDTMYSDEEVN